MLRDGREQSKGSRTGKQAPSRPASALLICVLGKGLFCPRPALASQRGTQVWPSYTSLGRPGPCCGLQSDLRE